MNKLKVVQNETTEKIIEEILKTLKEYQKIQKTTENITKKEYIVKFV